MYEQKLKRNRKKTLTTNTKYMEKKIILLILNIFCNSGRCFLFTSLILLLYNAAFLLFLFCKKYMVFINSYLFISETF